MVLMNILKKSHELREGLLPLPVEKYVLVSGHAQYKTTCISIMV
jgi:hypothetical protein